MGRMKNIVDSDQPFWHKDACNSVARTAGRVRTRKGMTWPPAGLAPRIDQYAAHRGIGNTLVSGIEIAKHQQRLWAGRCEIGECARLLLTLAHCRHSVF